MVLSSGVDAPNHREVPQVHIEDGWCALVSEEEPAKELVNVL